MIREFAARIEHIKVHDTDAPSAEVTEQLVTVGSEDQSYGLPLKPKPLILIRSGLHSGDFESVFGAWGWLKQFIRPAPHACPYAHALASRFRIAWIPCAAPWEPGDGWQRLGRPPLAPAAIEAEDCAMAAMIDIVSKPMNRARVITAMAADAPQGAKWLPRLFASFAPTGAFSYAPPPGADFRDRRLFNWGPWRPSFECAVDATMFVEGIHQDVQAAGGSLLRIEVPGHGADFVAQSIARTDLVATVLEHVIGMLYGLIVMNRRSAAVSFDGFAPLAPGEAIILPPDDPTLQMESSQAV
jgi:hypothetical protein